MSNQYVRTLLLSVSLLSLAACHSASGDTATTPAEISTASDVNASLPFQGSFASASEAEKIRAGFGCEKGHGHLTMDHDLRVNDSEIREMKNSSEGELTTTTVKNTYLGSDQDQKEHLTTKMLSISNDTRGEYLNTPFEYSSTCQSNSSGESTCTTDNSERDMVAILRAHLNSNARQQRSRFSKCAMGSNENTQVSYELGNYTLRNGQIVSALRQISKVTGVIVCHGRRVQHGSMTSDQIFSRDVISVDQKVGCGGTEISSGQTFRLDDGTIISSQRSEILEAPRR